MIVSLYGVIGDGDMILLDVHGFTEISPDMDFRENADRQIARRTTTPARNFVGTGDKKAEIL